MKSLSTQDFSTQNGSKRRSPNIIARLMGLDELLPQSSLHRELKPVKNQQRWPITSEKARGKNTYDDHKSLRRGLINEKKFKDVFQVLDAEKEKSSTSLYQRRVNANLTEPDIVFIRQKFTEAKSQSADENFCYSKEFNETLEALYYNKDLDDTIELSKQQLKKRSGLKQTEIVVLKPNLGKPQTTGRTLPSQSSSCDEVKADRRLPCTRDRELKAFGSLKANEGISLLRHKPRDSRAIARIVTRQMRASCCNDSSMNFEISRFRGYAGDESSPWSDPSSESKLVSVISRARTDFTRKNHRRSLPFRSSQSSVSKETVKRLSERWKLAHKSEQEIEIRRSNTLAEMLVTSDREASPESFNGITFKEGFTNRFESNVGQPKLQEPIGISSRDGWKSTVKKNLSKPKTIMHQNRTCGYTIVLPKKLTTRGGLVKRSSSKLLYMDDKLSKKKLPALKAQSSLSVHADSDTEDAKTTLSLEPPNLSATYKEGAMLVSSDEDTDQDELADETMITQELGEDWKSLYLADVLANSRFSDLDHDSFMATWHSSESPLEPSLFKDLEKKYSGLKTSTRLERKFLFHNISSEIFEQFADKQPCVKPTKVCPKCDINRIRETLRELVSIKYMKPSRETKEKKLQWLPNLEDDIEVIGKEIEEMLTDELIAELVMREIF